VPRALPARILLVLTFLLFGIAGPGLSADELFVRVRAGDSLFRIARTFDTTVDRIRADNGIQGDLIHPGQRLILRGTNGVKGSGSKKFTASLPIPGLTRRDVVVGFGENRSARHQRVVERHTGLDLRAREGTAILACESGVVRFVGELEGFGLLVILEHDGGWRSVYAPCDPAHLQVEVNEAVYEGQRLAVLGVPEESERSALHFEIRRSQQALDPMPFLRW